MESIGGSEEQCMHWHRNLTATEKKWQRRGAPKSEEKEEEKSGTGMEMANARHRVQNALTRQAKSTAADAEKDPPPSVFFHF